VYKLWSELKLFLENASQDHQYVTADYQLDDSSTWIEVGTFDTVPVEAQTLTALYPVPAHPLQAAMYSDDEAQTPRIRR